MVNVYLIENIVNKNKYIGITSKSIEARFKDHIKYSKMSKRYKYSLHYAIEKHGIDNFKVSLLRKCSNRDIARLFERAYIKKYNTYNNGYNETHGGDGGNAKMIKYSKEFVEEILLELINGKSVRQLSNKYKISKHTIYDFSRLRFSKSISIDRNILYKLKLYQSKKAKKGKNNIINIINDYISGSTLIDLANKYNMCDNSIWNIVNRNSYKNVKIDNDLKIKLLEKINSVKKKRKQKIITENDVINIFKLFSTGKYTRSLLCKKININSLDTITNILLRKNYKNINIDQKIIDKCQEYINDDFYYNKKYKKLISREEAFLFLIIELLNGKPIKVISNELGLTDCFLSEVLNSKKWKNLYIDKDVLIEFHKKFPNYLKNRR